MSETQPIQAAMLSRGRFALAAAASAVGIAACWWAQTPFGLLAPISALFLYAEGRAVPLLFTALGIGATGSFVAALSNAGALAPSWVALFAVAVCTGAIVAASKLTAAGAPGETDAAPGGPASLSLVHPEDREAAAQAAAYAFWTGVPQVLRCRERRPDGAYRWAEFRAEPGYGVSVDIDASVALPDERWSSREEPGETAEAVRAAKVIERLHGKAWAFDAGGRFTYVTPAAQAALGMTVDDLNAKLGGGAFIDGGGAGWMRKVHPDDVGRAADTLRHCLKTGEHWNIEYRMLRATGLYVWHRVSARPTRDGTGRITGWYGTSIDVDVYKKTEAALRGSERSLRQLVETVPALIWCTAPDGQPVYFSQQLRDFYGFDVGDKDLAGASRLANVLAAVIHPDDLTDVDKLFAHCLATGEPYALKHRQRRFDGEYRWIETRAAAMRNRFGEIVQWNGVCLDIEDQVRAQDELRRAQETLARASQAASLAELSASIAHEVNQPLAAVVANSHACQRWLDAEPPNIERAQRTVERIIRDANSAADVVSRIRALFKQSTDARTCTALGSVIAEARDLLAEEAARRSIRLDVEVGSDIPRAALDRVQIQQVLVNLMRNGMEAMEAAACSRVLDVRARLAGEAIRIEISDRGPGIEFPDRIFEPFFTTKPRGMGMGLAICRSIIESHGGRLWAERAAPHGATFIFTLPATAKAAP